MSVNEDTNLGGLSIKISTDSTFSKEIAVCVAGLCTCI